MREGVELIRGGLELAPRIEPLWTALFDHHLAVGAAGLATIQRSETWPRRLAHYRGLFAAHPEAEFLLAVRDGRDVGYAMRYVEREAGGEHGDGTMLLETLSVLPEARGNGIGSGLMDAVDRAARRSGITRSAVEVLGGNSRARDVYLERGYAPSTEHWLRSEPPGTGAPPGSGPRAPEAVRAGLRRAAEERGMAWTVLEGPDDTWVTASEMVDLGCAVPGSIEAADLERSVSDIIAAEYWTLFVEIPAAPAAPELRDALRGLRFRMCTERLERDD